MLHRKLRIFLILILVWSVSSLCLSSCRKTKYGIITAKQRERYNEIADNYVLSDCNLFYRSSGDWIAGELSIYDHAIILAEISDIGDQPFITGFFVPGMSFKGASPYGVYVLQHKDAPDPLTDWTVKDIRICKGGGYFMYSYLYYDTYDLYQAAVDSDAEPYYSWTDAGSDPQLVEDVRTVIQAEPTIIAEYGMHVAGFHSDRHEGQDQAVLCIHFEESDALVWMSPLFVDAEGYCVAKYTADEEDPSQRNDDSYYHLGDRWDVALEAVLHDMEKYVTESESGSATQESSESESVPVESENALQEMS